MEIQVKVINKSKNNLPKYETEEAAGLDIRADFSRLGEENTIKVFGPHELKRTEEGKILFKFAPGTRALIPTGIFTAIPKGYEVQIRPRSGLALKKGLTVINSPGTIDAK